MPLAKKEEKNYNYADYLTWDEKLRFEIIDGIVYDMSPAPNRAHQDISMNLSIAIGSLFKGKDCKVYHAPFDVRFSDLENPTENSHFTSVVQPDISIICDKSKLDDKGCKGAPDLVIEIISKSTAKKDNFEKFQLYQKHGVKEYWTIYPEEKFVNVYILDKSGLFRQVASYGAEDSIKIFGNEELSIDLSEIFEEK